MGNNIRILIVDDHPVVRQGLCSMLEMKPDMEVVGEAKDGLEAVNLSRELKPDVILMDLIMPKQGGLETITEIRGGNPQAHILVLTSFPEDDKIYSAIKAGALGYLLKDSPPEKLLQAIRDVHRGLVSLPPEIAVRLITEIQHSSESAQAETTLTKREADILRLAARAFTNQQIAAELVISEGTVRYHVSNILSKLHLSNRTQVALYALQHGWADLDSAAPPEEE